MSRVLGVVMVVALCAGCQNPTPVYDPFMGRTTVPPPGTAVPAPGQPYYAAPPAGGVPQAAPPLISPPAGASAMPQRPAGPSNLGPTAPGANGLSSSFTPNVSPVAQTAAVTPVSAAQQQPPPGAFPTTPTAQPINATPRPGQPIYGPPGGGIVYPPTSMMPPNGTPTLAQAPPATTGVPTPANPATDPANAVKPANWESAAGASAAGASPVVFNSSQDKNPIRIVSPPPGTVAATPKPNVSTATTPSTGTLNQSFAGGRVPEITDLPPAASAAKAAPAAATAVASTDAAATGYGYDPQYRWLKGKLEYSQATRSWRLRYIPPDGNTDNYGGSVVLANNSQLSGMQAGDAVYAQGSLGASSASQGSYAPQYNLQQIRRL